MGDAFAIGRCIDALQKWCVTNSIPVDHGFDHYKAVYEHAVKALRGGLLPTETSTAILLATLLHDVDDRKIVKEDSGGYSNANLLLRESSNEQYTDSVIEMVGLVSASKNGNSWGLTSWKYIPRDCDRLEALGEIGIQRCKEYSLRKKMPLYIDSTPMPITVNSLTATINARSLDQYVKSGGVSNSMLDHFYDKLLHLHCRASSNEYILEECRERIGMMKNWILSTNKTILLVREFEKMSNTGKTQI